MIIIFYLIGLDFFLFFIIACLFKEIYVSRSQLKLNSSYLQQKIYAKRKSIFKKAQEETYCHIFSAFLIP